MAKFPDSSGALILDGLGGHFSFPHSEHRDADPTAGSEMIEASGTAADVARHFGHAEALSDGLIRFDSEVSINWEVTIQFCRAWAKIRGRVLISIVCACVFSATGNCPTCSLLCATLPRQVLAALTT